MSTVAQKFKRKCRLCEVHDIIEIYENTLFHFIKGEIKGKILYFLVSVTDLSYSGNKINRATVTEDERKELVTKYLQFKELMNKIDEDEEEDGEGGPGSENPR